MNTRNLEFMEQGLKNLGFGDKMNMELAKNMNEGNAEFQLRSDATYGRDTMSAILSFRKSDQHDMYFFNKYEATVKKNNEQVAQTFYIEKNRGVTQKEAYNLLSGRAVNKDLVNKEGEKYNAWIQLDFSQKDKYGNYPIKQYHANYGYDLAQAVAKHPVKELSDPEQKDKLMNSLEKGNVQSVTFSKDGKEEKMFIEANPQYKTVNVFDGHMKEVKQENAKQGQDVKEAPVKAGELEPKADKSIDKKQPSKKNAQGNNSLLPKKRTANKKGMHL